MSVNLQPSYSLWPRSRPQSSRQKGKQTMLRRAVQLLCAEVQCSSDPKDETVHRGLASRSAAETWKTSSAWWGSHVDGSPACWPVTVLLSKCDIGCMQK